MRNSQVLWNLITKSLLIYQFYELRILIPVLEVFEKRTCNTCKHSTQHLSYCVCSVNVTMLQKQLDDEDKDQDDLLIFQYLRKF